MLSTPTTLSVQWGVFFSALSKECNIKEEMVWKGGMTCTLSIVGRCFLNSPCWPKPKGERERRGGRILKRSSAKLEHGFSLLLWVAWRSTELASHLVPHSATCLLALSSGPPWPTSKTPRKNIPRHQRNMDLASFPRSLRRALFNKIKIKNKWKIIMPTRTIRPSHTFQRVIANYSSALSESPKYRLLCALIALRRLLFSLGKRAPKPWVCPAIDNLSNFCWSVHDWAFI